VGLLLADTARRLAEAQIELEVTDAARAHVAREGYDPNYGARPLRRAIQREIENPLARRILAGEFAAGDMVRIDVRDGEIVFEKATSSADSGEGAEPVGAGSARD
jgi:ATP-dependent Clp protease ATP-binding subunit ClpB